MRIRTHDLLDAAVAAGVRYVDAARSYGRAEEFLGDWLSAHGLVPGAVTLGSKWGYTYTGEWRLDARVQEVKDRSVTNLRRQFAESRTLLGDYLSLFQIHSATLESGVLQDGAIQTELQRIKETGLEIGLTVTRPRNPRQSSTRSLSAHSTHCRQRGEPFERSATQALERAHGWNWQSPPSSTDWSGPDSPGHDVL